MSDGEWVELSAAIGALREQLLVAQREGAGKGLTFAVGKVEVELAVEAKRVGGGGLGVKFGIFSVDGKAELSSGSTHRIKLELIPRGDDGGSFDVADSVTAPPPR